MPMQCPIARFNFRKLQIISSQCQRAEFVRHAGLAAPAFDYNKHVNKRRSNRFSSKLQGRWNKKKTFGNFSLKVELRQNLVSPWASPRPLNPTMKRALVLSSLEWFNHPSATKNYDGPSRFFASFRWNMLFFKLKFNLLALHALALCSCKQADCFSIYLF